MAEQQTPASVVERLTRPIIGIENRTAQEVFDMMSDRARAALTQGESRHKAAPAPEGMREAIEVATEWLAIVENTPLQHGVIRRPPICRTEIEAIRTILAIIAKGEGRE